MATAPDDPVAAFYRHLVQHATTVPAAVQLAAWTYAIDTDDNGLAANVLHTARHDSLAGLAALGHPAWQIRSMFWASVQDIPADVFDATITREHTRNVLRVIADRHDLPAESAVNLARRAVSESHATVAAALAATHLAVIDAHDPTLTEDVAICTLTRDDIRNESDAAISAICFTEDVAGEQVGSRVLRRAITQPMPFTTDALELLAGPHLSIDTVAAVVDAACNDEDRWGYLARVAVTADITDPVQRLDALDRLRDQTSVAGDVESSWTADRERLVSIIAAGAALPFTSRSLERQIDDVLNGQLDEVTTVLSHPDFDWDAAGRDSTLTEFGNRLAVSGDETAREQTARWLITAGPARADHYAQLLSTVTDGVSSDELRDLLRDLLRDCDDDRFPVVAAALLTQVATRNRYLWAARIVLATIARADERMTATIIAATVAASVVIAAVSSGELVAATAVDDDQEARHPAPHTTEVAFELERRVARCFDGDRARVTERLVTGTNPVTFSELETVLDVCT